jgi:Holliday junction resolvasome RuvABC ATP-dependent DNA helicase subunit
MASRIGLPARTISSATEPFLIRLGLVDKDHHGKRVLTQKGHEHLRNNHLLEPILEES